MQGIGIYDIIILALAVFLGWRLFSVLGQTGDGELDDHDLASPALEEHVPAVKPATVHPSRLPRNLPPELQEGVMAILQAEPAFDMDRFLAGARMAYNMIVEAFSDGDVATLKPLLGDDVYEAFAAAIRSRGPENDQVRVESVTEATPLSARCDGREAFVTVRFRSRQAHVGGEAREVVDASDVWTFRRLLRQPDPNWIVVETRDAA